MIGQIYTNSTKLFLKKSGKFKLNLNFAFIIMFKYSTFNLLIFVDIFQVYETYADQADQWLMSKDAFLANDDLGVGLNRNQRLSFF